MLTTVAAGRVFDFSHAVGRGAISGEGFRLCVALAAVRAIPSMPPTEAGSR